MEVDSVEKSDSLKLVDKLVEISHDSNKFASMAFTINAMNKDNVEVLVSLFELYKRNNKVNMAVELLENDLLRRFDLNDEKSVFDSHLDKLASLIIKSNASTSKHSTTPSISQTNDDDSQFYSKVFGALSESSQAKLIGLLIEKFKSKLSFLRVADPPKPEANLCIAEFHFKLASTIQNLFLMKDLLIANSKFINEYGIYLVDSILNMEKQLFANLSASTIKLDPSVYSIERRSLNVLRRLCVIDLIPDFIYIIDKLDNRHCYRWIEKSLEFYCKFASNAVQVNATKRVDGSIESVNFSYTNQSLVHVNILSFTHLNFLIDDYKIVLLRILSFVFHLAPTIRH